MVAPTIQQFENNSNYTISKTADRTIVSSKPSTYDRDRTYIPEYYEFDEQGRITKGEIKGIRTTKSGKPRVYTKTVYAPAEGGYRQILKSETGAIIEQETYTYGGERTEYRLNRTLTDLQKKNKEYQEFKKVAMQAGAGEITRSEYDKLTKQDIEALRQVALRNQRAQEVKQAEQVLTKKGGFTREEGRNLIASKLFEKQGKQALFDQSGNAIVVAPLSAKLNPSVASSVIKSQKEKAQQPIEEKAAPNLFGASEISEAPKQNILTKFEETTKTFIDRKTGTGAGLLAGTGFAIYRTGKGVVKGVIAPFLPSTYRNLYTLVTNPKAAVEGVRSLGSEIRQDPGLLFEVGGEIYGIEKSTGFIKKGVDLIRKPTIASRAATQAKNIQIEAGKTLSVARTETIVKIGGKKIPVTSYAKELILTVDKTGLQATVSKVVAKAAKATINEYALGTRLVTTGESVGIEQAAIISRAGGKVAIAARTSQTLTREIVNYQGLSSDVGLTITRSSKLIKTTEKALAKGKVPKGVFKQTQPELTGTISKEIYAVGQERGALALTTQLRGKGAVKALQQAIRDRATIIKAGRKASNIGVSEPLGAGAQGAAKATASAKDLSLIQSLESASKKVARQAYLAEPVKGIPGVVPRPVTQIKTTQETEQLAKPKPKTETEQEPIQKIKIVSAVEAEEVQKAGPISAQSPKSSTSLDSIQESTPAQKQEEALIELPDVVEEVQQRSEARPRTPSSPFKTVPIIEPTIPLIVPRLPGNKSKTGYTDLFTTFVRRRGKFEAVGSFENVEEAARIGSNIAKGTAAASFKVVGPGGVVTGVLRGLNQAVFRKSKREPGVIVERRKARIDTPGELGEITFKGIAATRRSKSKNPLSNIFG